jgi:hypothetical protein
VYTNGYVALNVVRNWLQTCLVFGVWLVYKYMPGSRYSEGVFAWFSLFRLIYSKIISYINLRRLPSVV